MSSTVRTPGTVVTNAGAQWGTWSDSTLQTLLVDTAGMLGGLVYDSGAQLTLGGTQSNHTLEIIIATNDTFTYGDATSLFALTPTAAQVRASSFGFTFGFKDESDQVGPTLTVSNFSFDSSGDAVPAGATIDGIAFSLHVTLDAGATLLTLDTFSMTVYWTPGAGGATATANRTSSINRISWRGAK